MIRIKIEFARKKKCAVFIRYKTEIIYPLGIFRSHRKARKAYDEFRYRSLYRGHNTTAKLIDCTRYEYDEMVKKFIRRKIDKLVNGDAYGECDVCQKVKELAINTKSMKLCKSCQEACNRALDEIYD